MRSLAIGEPSEVVGVYTAFPLSTIHGEVHDLDPDRLPAGGFDPDRWVDLDEALTRFAGVDPAAAELAHLRVFGGLSVEEAGDALGLPRATAFRTWTYARAWLTARLADGSET